VVSWLLFCEVVFSACLFCFADALFVSEISYLYDLRLLVFTSLFVGDFFFSETFTIFGAAFSLLIVEITL